MATPFDCTLIRPEQAGTNMDGCPVLTRRRHVSVPKGVCGTVEWTMRDANGEPVDFSGCLSTSVSEDGSVSEGDGEAIENVMVRFQGCDAGSPVLAEVEATIVSAADGTVQFQLPEVVCQSAGLFLFQVGLMRGNAPIFVSGGLISVEPGLWGDTTNMSGPPTIQEIRYFLKDRAEENTLLGAVEFDDAEILEAIRWPVFEFNESPPPIRKKFNCNTFPYRYNWLKAIAGNLLLTAVNHYLRNKMQAAGTNLSVDSKNKDDAYLRLSKMYRDEWQLFIREKKCELNARGAWGTVH